MICEVCGHAEFRSSIVNKTFIVDERPILVEGIPAEVCASCGESNFSAEVAERLRQLLHEPHQPVRVIETEVVDFNAA